MRPLQVDVRVPLEIETLGETTARVGVVGQERERSALEREPGSPLRPVVGQAVLDGAWRIDVDDGRASRLHRLEDTGNQVSRRRLRGLVDESAPVRHGDQGELFSLLLLALVRLAPRGHVGDLTGVAARARLPTRVRVDLCVEHDDPERFAGGEQTGQVLESDVEHGTVSAHRDDRRAERHLLVGELLPVELDELLLVNFRVPLVGKLELRLSDRRESIGHLTHVSFEDADGERGSILEEMVCPRERVRVVRIGAAPDRGASGRVGHSEG